MCLFVRVSPFLFLPYLRVNTGTSPLVDEGLILWFFFFLFLYIYWILMCEGRKGRVRRGGCGGEEMKGIKEKHCSIIQVLSHVMPCTCSAVISFFFFFLFPLPVIASYQWYRN
ncbi:hypothetical protein B9Z19DRAFT_1089684 [Tuber borchii]|uniref:Uncharacterized protein n=1 Tax=Tuber borchii TaxID=42251 RepID=A0A2T6ZJX6_TUBBO|nr:hypothetical protein B9Z19DRAFT_1089684 [Tuber borchii]